jgi:hypothetical protein
MTMPPTYRFQDGSLYIATAGREMRLRWSPEPVAEQTQGKRWQSFRPAFRLLSPSSALSTSGRGETGKVLAEKYAAFEAFRSIIDPGIVSVVEPFQSHQWPLLALLGESKAAQDLVLSSPALAYSLANNEHFRATPVHAAALHAVRYSHRKQRDILAWLGFPGTEAMARLMRKVTPAIVYPGLIRRLRQAVLSPDMMKHLSHLSRVNTGVVYLASLPEAASLITPRLLAEVGADPEEDMSAQAGDVLADVMRMATELCQTRTLRPFATCRKLRECHERLSREDAGFQAIKERQAALRVAMAKVANANTCDLIAQSRMVEMKVEFERLDRQRPDRPARPAAAGRRTPTIPLIPAVFPPPPIPGSAEIVPVTTLEELVAEGQSQSNCLGRNTGYVNGVADGSLYIYRVLRPQRHTLAIRRCGQDCWQISDLQRKGNAPPTPEALDAVQRWLDVHQIAL